MRDFQEFLRNRVLTMRTLLFIYAATVTVLVFTVWWQAEQLLRLPPPLAESNYSGLSGEGQARQGSYESLPMFLPASGAADDVYGEHDPSGASVGQSGYVAVQPVIGRDDPSAPPLALSQLESRPLEQQLVWPVQPVEIVTAYGRYKSPTLLDWRHHAGLDLAVPEGTAVVAVLPGRVTEIRDDEGLGRMLILEHASGFESRYGNLGQVRVQRGDHVQQSQLIAEVGRTARYEAVEESHLHWEIWQNGASIDPLTLIEQIS